MLFQSTLPSLFEKLSVSTVSQLNAERKKETQKRLDYFHDDTADYLDEKLTELFSEPDQLVKCQLNVVKKIVSQLAQVYRDAPAREIEGEDQDQKIFKEIAETAKLDVVLKQATRYAKLLKTILLRPVYRSGKMQVDLYTGEILDVVTGDTPEELLEVLITDYGNAQRMEEITFSHWTAETWKKIDFHGRVVEEEENPYQVLPFVPVFDFLPPGTQFWLPGGADLIEIQDAINIKLVDLLHLLANQSFGVGFIKGGQGSGASLRVDPGSLVELEEDGEIGFASQKARLIEVVHSIDKLVKWACVSNGLSASSMSTDLSDRQSGEAKRVDRTELHELRLDDVALWRGYERQLFDLIKIVWNVHNPRKKFSEKAVLQIDFADPTPPVDPKMQAESWQMQLDMGVTSPVDIIMQMNPDLKDRESALAHLLKLRQENAELEIPRPDTA